MVQGTSFSPSKQRIEPKFSSPCQVMPEVKYLSSSKAKVLMDLDVRHLQGFAEAYPRDGTSSVRSGGFLRGYPQKSSILLGFQHFH